MHHKGGYTYLAFSSPGLPSTAWPFTPQSLSLQTKAYFSLRLNLKIFECLLCGTLCSQHWLKHLNIKTCDLSCSIRKEGALTGGGYVCEWGLIVFLGLSLFYQALVFKVWMNECSPSSLLETLRSLGVILQYGIMQWLRVVIITSSNKSKKWLKCLCLKQSIHGPSYIHSFIHSFIHL